MSRKGVPAPAQPFPGFDLHTFLDSAGIARTISKYRRSAVIFSQGDPATDVFYIQEGSVKLSVLSRTGKEAVVGVLGPGDFFGELALLDGERRAATVIATTQLTTIRIERNAFRRLLREEPELAIKLLEGMARRTRRILDAPSL